jgi:hypothetical protein
MEKIILIIVIALAILCALAFHSIPAGNDKTIPLTQGQVALIDNRDYWLVRQFNWHAQRDNQCW